MKILKMNFARLIAGIIVCFLSTNLSAQTENGPPVKKHKFVIYAGVGPSLYFNNLVLAKDNVKEFNYSIAGRLMWEPEHNLSLGIESGYYQLYTLNFPSQPDIKIRNYAIPIQLVVCMKFLKTFYFNFSSGQTILLNKVSAPNQEINASTLSLGDFAGSIGYRRQFKERISFGAETKFFYASKLDDKNIALLFMAGFSF